jgi:hypothetical protein
VQELSIGARVHIFMLRLMGQHDLVEKGKQINCRVSAIYDKDSSEEDDDYFETFTGSSFSFED